MANSRRAKKVLAVLAGSGCYFPRCLTIDPANGPEDVSLVVDSIFGMGRGHARCLMRQWLPYIDDFCIRTGRWRQGTPVTDEEHDEALSKVAGITPSARAAAEALREKGFVNPA